ncbi:Protein OBERON 2 [Hibiscus syriacus]|uniref:OBERON-like protein n=1 Tax=Hibiscus syriacus TaxID=106335 RepID=A0A6A3ADJ5_HIBSY|nr:Protein OBERON 2 [Hibiscus syriacus]
MGKSSGSNINHQHSSKMFPPRQQPRSGSLHTSLSLVSSDPRLSPDAHKHRSNSDNVLESPNESASSRETWHTADAVAPKEIENVKIENDCLEQSVIRRVYELKNKAILEGNGGSQNREEFFILQKYVQSRSDLTAKTLIRAHRSQLEILVAINMGIQAFLHPNVSLSQTSLIEVFVYKRCRNVACQNQLPADYCTCEICANRNGFCNLCMFVTCNKFDFEVNTCRWIGCDLCSHWTHTDCAIRDGQICMGPSVKCAAGPTEMLFSRIFRGSDDPRGKKLFWKCEDLLEKMRGGLAESAACRSILVFFQELGLDSPTSLEYVEGGPLIAAQDACNRIADAVQEAIRKMEMVADEKTRLFKKARLSLDACERELEDKAKEVAELKLERQKMKMQIEELEKIVRLKLAEADMFQLKANEAKREAERLQRIALAKADKSEEDYASSYLKQRLSEAEAEKQYLFEKIKLQETSRALQSNNGGDSSKALMYSKIHDLLHGCNTPSKTEFRPNERHGFRTNMRLVHGMKDYQWELKITSGNVRLPGNKITENVVFCVWLA